MIEEEEEELNQAREFVCRLIMVVYEDIEKLILEQSDSDPEYSCKLSWPECCMRRIFMCIYDMPGPNGCDSIFRKLISKYELRLNYSKLHEKLDERYRLALLNVNKYRKDNGLEPYLPIEALLTSVKNEANIKSKEI